MNKRITVTFTESQYNEIAKRAQLKCMDLSAYLRYIYGRHIRMNPREDQ